MAGTVSLTSSTSLPISLDTPVSASSQAQVAVEDELGIDDFEQLGSYKDIEDLFEKLGAPTGNAATGEAERLDSEDDWDDMSNMGAVNGPDETPCFRTAYLPKNEMLNAELSQQFSINRPDIFFGFVANHTNPNRIEYSLRNFLLLVIVMIMTGKFSFVLQRNCVHCTHAVDRTLAQFIADSGPESEPQMYQLAERNAGAFVGIKGSKLDIALTRTAINEVLYIIEDQVPAGKRAGIRVPVAGLPFAHAMNYVHLDSGEKFIICGQQRTRCNLQLPTDVIAFHTNYNVTTNRY